MNGPCKTGAFRVVTDPGILGKAEDKRAAIIAKQAERQKAEQPNAGPLPKRATNWAATSPVKPRRGRPPSGGDRR
jgi:hypothetical protein